MPRTRARRLRPAACALVLGAGLLSAAPAGAQPLVYEVPFGPPPRSTGPRYEDGVLAPGVIRSIVRGMGYRNVSVPHLRGRVYAITATDEEGPALLRIDAYTGHVVAAVNLNGGPTTAVPGPDRAAPPRGARRVARPPVNVPSTASAPPPAPPLEAAPLPPSRPPEAAVAAVTPALVVPPPAPAAPGASPAVQEAAPVSPPPEATPPTASGSAAAVNPAPAQPPRRTAGAGTATTDSASAGTASVVSKPKAQ